MQYRQAYMRLITEKDSPHLVEHIGLAGKGKRMILAGPKP